MSSLWNVAKTVFCCPSPPPPPPPEPEWTPLAAMIVKVIATKMGEIKENNAQIRKLKEGNNTLAKEIADLKAALPLSADDQATAKVITKCVQPLIETENKEKADKKAAAKTKAEAEAARTKKALEELTKSEKQTQTQAKPAQQQNAYQSSQYGIRQRSNPLVAQLKTQNGVQQIEELFLRALRQNSEWANDPVGLLNAVLGRLQISVENIEDLIDQFSPEIRALFYQEVSIS